MLKQMKQICKKTFTPENSRKREMCFKNSESPLRILTYLDLPCLISTDNSKSFQKLEAVVQRSSVKKGVLKNFAKLPGKRLCQSLFFNKISGLKPATLLKNRLWHRGFPVNFAKFPRTPFFTELHWWLLLKSSMPVDRVFSVFTK